MQGGIGGIQGGEGVGGVGGGGGEGEVEVFWAARGGHRGGGRREEREERGEIDRGVSVFVSWVSVGVGGCGWNGVSGWVSGRGLTGVGECFR